VVATTVAAPMPTIVAPFCGMSSSRRAANVAMLT
jgi:hypothetical protein